MDANWGGWWPPSDLSRIKNAAEWAHDDYDADLYNLSAGYNFEGGWDNNFCKYFDHIAYEWNRLPVCAAGNIAKTGDYVASPANAWNVLAAGGIDDNNTATWGDDTFWEEAWDGSGWRNPETPHGDREKPEVCAPAKDIRTTIPGDDFDTGSGTSAAAPQVAGIAAQLIEQDSDLRDKPALLKAIIMASAIHNVEPDNDYYQWGHDSPYANVELYRPMDHKEGVGTVDAKAAYDCVANDWIWSEKKKETELPFPIQFYAEEGEKVRFVITWYAHTDYHGSGDYGLCADMTLEIVGGPWYPWWSNWYGGSKSRDSAWEIVRFTAPYTGNYYARVSAFGSGSDDPWTYDGPDGERIAAAWYRW